MSFSASELAEFSADGYGLCGCPLCSPHFLLLSEALTLCPDCAGCPAEFERRAAARKPVKLTPHCKPGFVYFARSNKTGLVKIGRSFNVKRRLGELQSRLKDRLELIRCVSVDNALEGEQSYHARFADKRRHGEWFELVTDDLATL